MSAVKNSDTYLASVAELRLRALARSPVSSARVTSRLPLTQNRSRLRELHHALAIAASQAGYRAQQPFRQLVRNGEM